MEYSIKTGDLTKQRTACLILGVFAKRQLSPSALLVDKASKGHLKEILKRGDMNGESGQQLMLYDVPGIQAERVLLLGLGKASELNRKRYMKALTASIKSLNDGHAIEAVWGLCDVAVSNIPEAGIVRETIIQSEESLYQFAETKSTVKKRQRPLKRLAVWLADRRQLKTAQKGLQQGKAIAKGIKLTKDLGNLPGNYCTPTYLADQAKKLGRSNAKLKVQVLEEKQMEKLGMGALLSVSRGSRQPAKLIIMNYQGGKADAKPVVLVGKGLTFDAGGISLKPAAAMDEMKYDMCGGASVFGTMMACLEMDLPINLIGVVPSSENLPDGDANKPGDVVTSMSGQTIEVLNTDAEGRLILCDALTYSERFNPATVIDIATLTGACIVALGNQASGLMANNEALAEELLDAGSSCGDRAWQLPLWDEYQEQLDSNFADMANIGGKGAGTITAACFLSRYTKKFKWAHLDIAGTAWRSGAAKGATGRPVPLLTRFLMGRCGL
ncbi:MAG: leucyl aminopeptidase [Candidatus Thiodiazotropha lotti]|nr:leucyl aminopeptidase [Candidatus Thiodiazotropha lotti]MCW4191933.1 leucyl aminopeptidase [Candidatus Thiodiazotropha weberae]